MLCRRSHEWVFICDAWRGVGCCTDWESIVFGSSCFGWKLGKGMELFDSNPVLYGRNLSGEAVYEKMFDGNVTRWQEGLLLIEIAVFIVLGVLGSDVPNGVVNAVIASFSAMKYCAFRSFGENTPFATVFSTGNMRSLVDNVYEGVTKRESMSWKRAVGYMAMLVAFALGAVGNNLLCRMFAYRACWLVSVALFVVLILIQVLTCIMKEDEAL